jgi:diguanylate cyclase (GGDEF)-like protein
MKLYSTSGAQELKGFELENKKYYASISNFQSMGNNWNVYVVLADADFLKDMNEAINKTVLVIIIVMIVFFTFIFFTARSVAKPIINLNKAAHELSKGNLIIVEDTKRKDELGELIRSFNWMGKKLTGLLISLELEVAERTEKLEETNVQLMRLSFLDGLTGVANRRKFDQAFEKEWKFSINTSKKIGLLMLDIDVFKNYNDTYGHQMGDECLKAIGRVLLKVTLGTENLAARYGGEEFILMLPNADKESLTKLANAIISEVEALNIEHKTSPFKRVTLSIGVALTIAKEESEPSALIEIADKALYKAKENGRNRIEIE